jgi:uncharacterized protein YifE (UPF0438 family)
MNIDTTKKSRMILKLSGVVNRPLDNGTWQPITTDNKSFMIELNGHDEQILREQMLNIFNEIVQKYS